MAWLRLSLLLLGAVVVSIGVLLKLSLLIWVVIGFSAGLVIVFYWKRSRDRTSSRPSITSPAPSAVTGPIWAIAVLGLLVGGVTTTLQFAGIDDPGFQDSLQVQMTTVARLNDTGTLWEAEDRLVLTSNSLAELTSVPADDVDVSAGSEEVAEKFAPFGWVPDRRTSEFAVLIKSRTVPAVLPEIPTIVGTLVVSAPVEVIDELELLPDANSTITLVSPCWLIISTNPKSERGACSAETETRIVSLDRQGSVESDSVHVRATTDNPFVRSQIGVRVAGFAEQGWFGVLVTAIGAFLGGTIGSALEDFTKAEVKARLAGSEAGS